MSKIISKVHLQLSVFLSLESHKLACAEVAMYPEDLLQDNFTCQGESAATQPNHQHFF